MSSGAISVPYMTVSAKVARNDNNPNGSTPSSGGEETGSSWIYWTSDGGFVNKGWCWEATNNYILTGWANSGLAEQYGDGQFGFLEYMKTNPDNLDLVLGNWDPISKGGFVSETRGYLGVYGGIYGESTGTECIEYRG